MDRKVLCDGSGSSCPSSCPHSKIHICNKECEIPRCSHKGVHVHCIKTYIKRVEE